jgi:hypothetical protein
MQIVPQHVRICCLVKVARTSRNAGRMLTTWLSGSMKSNCNVFAAGASAGLKAQKAPDLKGGFL